MVLHLSVDSAEADRNLNYFPSPDLIRSFDLFLEHVNVLVEISYVLIVTLDLCHVTIDHLTFSIIIVVF